MQQKHKSTQERKQIICVKTRIFWEEKTHLLAFWILLSQKGWLKKELICQKLTQWFLPECWQKSQALFNLLTRLILPLFTVVPPISCSLHRLNREINKFQQFKAWEKAVKNYDPLCAIYVSKSPFFLSPSHKRCTWREA